MAERLTMRLQSGAPMCRMVSTEFCLLHDSCYNCGQFKNMVAALADAEDAKERQLAEGWGSGLWIPVEERLPTQWWHPEDENHVHEPMEFLVFIEGAEVPTTKLFNGSNFVDETGFIYKVTDWMDMPLPPKRHGYFHRKNTEQHPLSRMELGKMVGQPVWVTHHDGSGGRWGIVNRYESGLCADVADGVSYWFDGMNPAIAYREKKEK